MYFEFTESHFGKSRSFEGGPLTSGTFCASFTCNGGADCGGTGGCTPVSTGAFGGDNGVCTPVFTVVGGKTDVGGTGCFGNTVVCGTEEGGTFTFKGGGLTGVTRDISPGVGTSLP